MSSDQEPASSWTTGIPYRLWHVNQAVHRRVESAIAELGVTVTQLGIAVHLDDFGHLSASDLARMFRLTPQSTTLALGRLEKGGYVERVPHPTHKRVIWYELTRAGVDLADRGRTRVAAVDEELATVLGAEASAVVDAALTALERAADEEVARQTMWPVPRRRQG
ncbi:MarR family winged helix-turn-helix transcriptional regulator [Microbacterium sp.]|uniref:MarR family winged helix-turn-helix transcriptional regulator n=1 Tax=Microbacterium sp. TaxID=51671 RepID=UPI003A88B674